MINKVNFLFIFIAKLILISGCSSYSPCAIFERAYKLKVGEIPEINNGNYYLCNIIEEPQICIMDSSLKLSFPKHLINEKINYVLIRIKVKPIEMYFTKYSREEALRMWLALNKGYMLVGEEYKDPLKKGFLDFNTFYFITCNSSDIKKFKRLYYDNEIVLFDQQWPEVESGCFYSLNGYSAKKVDLSKLFSFEDVMTTYFEEKSKIEKK
jgi:hypothetical protein